MKVEVQVHCPNCDNNAQYNLNVDQLVEGIS